MLKKMKVRRINKAITEALYSAETLAAFRNGHGAKGDELLASWKRELMEKAGIRTTLELEQLYVKHVGLYNWPEPIEKTAICHALAEAFAHVLHRDLGEATMNKVIELNRSYSDSVCATADFCDANMAMLEAWEAVVPMEHKAEDESAATLWNEAWDIAKRFEFSRDRIANAAAAADARKW